MTTRQSLNQKTLFLLILGFVLTSISGMTSVEFVRIQTAKYFHYDYMFDPGLGRFFFYKPEPLIEVDFGALWLESDKIEKRPFEDAENNRVLFWINMNGGLLAIISACFGFFLTVKGRRIRSDEMKLINWIGFFLSMILFRYVVAHAIGVVYSFMPCTEAMAYHHIGNPWLIQKILFTIELLFAGWVTSRLPVKLWTETIISGIIGGALGVMLWAKEIGLWLENVL